MFVHIEVKDNKLYSPMPETGDTRPAEVITVAIDNADIELMELYECFKGFNDDHWLSKNYRFEYFENVEALSLMKVNNNIVGFSCIKKLEIGNRILTRLYQSMRVPFTREVLRPTIYSMVEQQLLMCDILGLDNVFISREPRSSTHFRMFTEALNRRSSSRWTFKEDLTETVPNSFQYTAWRIK